MRQKSKWIASFGLFAAVTGIAFAASVGMPERQAKTLIASCAACHGSKGEGLEARSAPRLAGLDPTFMEGQLTHFAKGLRGTHPGDTFGSQMHVIAQSLGPEERKTAAAHYAKLSAPAAFSTIPTSSGQLQRGKQAYESCAACHGADGMGNADLGAPRLAGQADWYILTSLKAYQSGARGYDPSDVAGQQMAQSARAVMEKDLAPVSSYASSLGRN